jgi:hypothetical protein
MPLLKRQEYYKTQTQLAKVLLLFSANVNKRALLLGVKKSRISICRIVQKQQGGEMEAHFNKRSRFKKKYNHDGMLSKTHNSSTI